MTRKELAELAQRSCDNLVLPTGINAVVIITDESGAYIGVGGTASKEYTDKLVWCAAHGEDRIDHKLIIN